MKIRDIGKPVTANSLNESLAARFGKKLDLGRFTLEQLEDSRNKLRTRLKDVETTESFDSVHNETYQKTKMYLDVLNAEISERGGYDVTNEGAELTEASKDEAELVMASTAMVDRLTSWMEDVAEMQTETMLELADAIRDELGSEMSEQFVNTVKPGLESLYATMDETRRSLTAGVGILTGESTGQETLGDTEPGLEPEGDAGMEPDLGDDADLADIDAELASDDEATADLGNQRPRRESIERVNNLSKKNKMESFTPTKLASILSKKK